MSSGESARPPAAGRGSPDEYWRLVERIAESKGFARAAQLRGMLRFIAHRALFDRVQEISESEIACKVLGRNADFDPRVDNIVRVQARQLRTRLDEFFTTDGRAEAVVVTIPKGSYVPEFSLRQTPPHAPRSFPWIPLAAALLIILTAAGFFVLGRWTQAPVRQAPNPLLARIFRPGQPTNIVVADTNFTLVLDYTKTSVSIDDYLKPGLIERLSDAAPDASARDVLRSVFDHAYVTSLGDAVVVARMAQQSVRYGSSVVVRSARHLNFRDWKSGNYILVGGPRAVPWVDLFQDRLNFLLEGDPKKMQFWFRNKSPLPGEQARYTSHLGLSSSDSHVVIALLPGLGDRGDVLLLTGILMEGTEAAAEFVEHAVLPKDLDDWLRSQRHYAELLVHTKGVSSESWKADLVAYRKLDAARLAAAGPAR